MEPIGKILNQRIDDIVSNDNKKISNPVTNVNTSDNVKRNNNDNNVNEHIEKNKYAFNPDKFSPFTRKAQIALEIAKGLGDEKNYANYRKVVNTIDQDKAYRLFRSTLDDVKAKEKTNNPVRNRGAWFMWKYKNHQY
ncbi:MAG: hypothetical protein UR89_C0015G0014 [Candidatus Roizmanbacteria bacterium GW2011_GWA2_35_8]|uniref:Uncharacterized protein n=1 Tax=Candidatus Roizmanbacteria bacterium GW2011_GWA2_35_8 TaxID=1618479 RepID=A0A0G0DDK4_9BACT|nr:MAG: hypothetical protein UR89_C0015G0014 [Candidatus Roizmanbacteria bacterium GW2011_GWA2_35_8]